MFSWEGPLPVPQPRTIGEIRGVLMDPACECREPLYYMYRDLSRLPGDRAWLRSEGLRYDVTVIPARTLCGEYVKTKGHHHPPGPGGIPYPEIYEVLEGRAHFLLQTRAADDVRLVEARQGDRALIPPGYGHVTINPGREALVMANLVSTRFESDYSAYEEHRGAAYFELEGGTLRRNPRYPVATAPVRVMAARDQPGPRLLPEGPLYDLVGTESLGFLNRPGDYPALFA
jgi:glucose-6-phosphate isomerase